MDALLCFVILVFAIYCVVEEFRGEYTYHAVAGVVICLCIMIGLYQLPPSMTIERIQTDAWDVGGSIIKFDRPVQTLLYRVRYPWTVFRDKDRHYCVVDSKNDTPRAAYHMFVVPKSITVPVTTPIGFLPDSKEAKAEHYRNDDKGGGKRMSRLLAIDLYPRGYVPSGQRNNKSKALPNVGKK
jgi:hypothetical protein